MTEEMIQEAKRSIDNKLKFKLSSVTMLVLKKLAASLSS